MSVIVNEFSSIGGISIDLMVLTDMSERKP